MLLWYLVPPFRIDLVGIASEHMVWQVCKICTVQNFTLIVEKATLGHSRREVRLDLFVGIVDGIIVFSHMV